LGSIVEDLIDSLDLLVGWRVEDDNKGADLQLALFTVTRGKREGDLRYKRHNRIFLIYPISHQGGMKRE